MKKMLFVNGTLNDVPLVEVAHHLGFYVITSGNNPSGEAHKFSDDYRQVDYSDKEAIYQLAKELKVDAICSCGNDLCAMSAAYAAEKLGLPGHDSFETAKVFHEKDEFRRVTQKLGLSVPSAVSFDNQENAEKYILTAKYPLIIKPTDLGGGKGISVANNAKEAERAVRIAFQASKAKHIVVEQYITGTNHSVTFFLVNEKVVFDYSTNDTSYMNPFLVWTSTYLADGYDLVRNQIISDIERLAHEVHARDGILTIQYMMSNGKPYYLETMRRCLGNFHYACMSKDIGVNLYEWFVASEAGLDCQIYVGNVNYTGTVSGFVGLYADENGIVDRIEIDKDFEKLIFKRFMFNDIGYEISDYLNDKIGNILVTFKDKNERDFYMAKVRSLVKVITR